ncbi:MAG: GDP-mannose 4,6-dehydratase [Theionarchaea archaeon]|nr:GDP-mannose 4,6-dehydratase [Theionarchaea archaeon]MBU7038449.1 GDP-mannose 4,6-dehydratase [Theionarchaea archaeon]
MEKILVTGGAGFIGSHLVDHLVSCGEVVVIDNFETGKISNLKQVRDRIRLVKGDIRDSNLLKRVIVDIDTVFHFAASASVPLSFHDPRIDLETNALGTLNLLQAAAESDVERIIYASSAAVYGEPQYLPVDEDHPVSPISPYGMTKYLGERYGMIFRERYGISFSSARIFNVYGPRQANNVVHDLLSKLSKNPRTLEVLGTGEQVRDFSHIADIIDALLLIAKRGDGTYNVASGNAITVRELAQMLVGLIFPSVDISYTGSSWEGDVSRLSADIARLSELGFIPRVPLEEGLSHTVQWFFTRRREV